MTPLRVAILHPWLPIYRDAFFRLLVERAGQVGIQINVFAGETPPEWSARGDTLTDHLYTRLPTTFYRLGKRTLVSKDLAPLREGGPYDLIILEQAVRNLETYRLLLRPSGARVAFWGHGRTYTEPTRPLQEKVKEWITRNGDWFFAYTSGGAEAMEASGFPAQRITVVQNAIDSTALCSSIEAVEGSRAEAFRRAYDLRGKTALFIGGIDGPKRLPFLLRSAEIVHANDSDFRLLVAGDGSQRALVEDAARSHQWVQYLGSIRGPQKAVAFREAQVLAMPGRVGLVAVDSFAARTPIVTTSWPWHAPEFEYLVDGRNAVISKDDEQSYAGALLKTLSNPLLLGELMRGCGDDIGVYSIENMVDNFMSGLVEVLGASRPGRAADHR